MPIVISQDSDGRDHIPINPSLLRVYDLDDVQLKGNALNFLRYYESFVFPIGEVKGQTRMQERGAAKLRQQLYMVKDLEGWGATTVYQPRAPTVGVG